ncbi:MAG TPA: polyphosphate kinase 2 family protein, partial [Flavobacteriaceae bacterium]|nr:polyphosphate kinase 2 family protein [Flavobacteriaceae bacterium]
QEVLNRTSFDHAPWYAIPADNKPAARLLVASILLNELKQYNDIKEPELDADLKERLQEFKDQLQNE